jgi:hypothetical protein
MSAEIIPFVPRSRPEREVSDFSPIIFRSAPRPDDLTMDHADPALCEYRWPAAKKNEPPDRFPR